MRALFGRYRPERVLGRGGMGVVHAAHDTVLDREVALKIVAPHLADDPEFRARFQHEAEVLAKLDSDRIVRIYDYGEHEGSLFIVTQLVDGGDLQTLVTGSGPLSPALAVDVVCQVLDALRDAHAVGVIHRDIKPANVLLRQRQGEVEAFLCDFGIAATAGASFTQTGGVAGSLPYLAPERHEGQEATPASDVYAVGCLLWAALTGSAPFAGTDADVLFGHLYGPVPKLPGRDEFSRRANAVLAKALAKEPRKRYPTAAAMAAELRPLADRAPGSIALPGATSVRRPVVVRRRRWVAPVAAVAGVLAVVGTGVGVASLGDSDPRGRDALPVPATLTETIPAADGMLLGNQVTLSPRPVRRTQADGDVVLAPPPVLEELPPAVVDGAGEPAGQRTSRPRAGSTVRSPAPVRTSAAAAPVARHQCWDGSREVRLSSCSFPSGSAGARYVFPDFGGLGCVSRPLASGMAEHWRCAYTAGGSPHNFLYFTRWHQTETAKDHYYGRYLSDGQRNRGAWDCGGRTCPHYHGLHRSSPSSSYRWRWARVYDVSGVTWAVAADAVNKDARNRSRELVTRYRDIDHLRGHPL